MRELHMSAKDFLLVPMPPAIALLPRDRRGYPIPYSADIKPDGTPDFTTIDMMKWLKACQFRLCGICGKSVHGRLFFIGGPRLVKNRYSFDHPMHEECAHYALQVCPFLSMTRAHYQKLRESPDHKLMKTSSRDKPDIFALAKARSYTLEKISGDMLLHASPWESITWWKEGKEVSPNDTEIQAPQ